MLCPGSLDGSQSSDSRQPADVRMEKRRHGLGRVQRCRFFLPLGMNVVTLKVTDTAAHPLKATVTGACGRHDPPTDIVPRFADRRHPAPMSGRPSRICCAGRPPARCHPEPKNSISARTRAQARWLAQAAFGCCECHRLAGNTATCTTVFKVVDTTPRSSAASPGPVSADGQWAGTRSRCCFHKSLRRTIARRPI